MVREDERLAAEIRAGSVTAFERLFSRYYEPLVHFADRYTRTEQHSEDTVCELFEWIWSNRAGWSPGVSVEAYLYGALRNRLLNKLRSEEREKGRAEAYASLHEQESLEPALSDANDAQASLAKAVDELPEQQRLAILLRWDRQMSWEEVSQVLSLSPDAARMLNQRAIRRLRELMSGLSKED